MKVNDILNLNAFFGKLADKDLEFSVSLRLAKLAKDYTPYLETFEKEKQKLFNEYGELSEDGMQTIVTQDKVPEFNEKLTALVETEVEIERPSFKLEDFDKLQLSMKDVMPIIGFME